MHDPVDRIVKSIKSQGEKGCALRIGKVTGVPDPHHVTLDFSGSALISRDADIATISVGDRVYCLQHHGVIIVVGRLSSL